MKNFTNTINLLKDDNLWTRMNKELEKEKKFYLDRDCKKMAENSKLKILNIMNGAEFGGAELFFERVALSFEKRTSISQKILIRANERRFHKLQKNRKH